MKKILTAILVVAMLMSLAVPVQAEPGPGIDIGRDLSKLPTQFVPAIRLESVGLPGRYVTVNETTGEISLKKKCGENEKQSFMLWEIEDRPGYYYVAIITDYGNWKYLNQPGPGKPFEMVYSRFDNGVYHKPKTAIWQLKWHTIKTQNETGWAFFNKETRQGFCASGRGVWKIRVLNNSAAQSKIVKDLVKGASCEGCAGKDKRCGF